MTTTETRERNRAVRIAYSHARNGAGPLADRWLALAEQFDAPTARQRAHVEELLRVAVRTIPGQLDIEGKEHR